MKIKDTKYLYSSARIRALERTLLNRDALERMLEADSAADAAKVLAEYGYSELGNGDMQAVERAIAASRLSTFSLVREISPNPEIINVFSIKYDYHNIKALIKAQAVGADASRLLINAGRVDADKLTVFLREMDYSALAPTMAQACIQAREVLSRTKDAQLADFILDRACFEEISACAQNSGSEFLQGYVRLMIDVTNLRSLIRAIKQGKSPEFLASAIIPGGNVSVEATAVSQEIVSKFSSPLLEEAAQAGVASLSGDSSFTVFERLCDDALMKYIQGARYVPFGDAPIIAYLAAQESQISLIRILMAGKLQKLPTSEIRDRLRLSYV